MKTVVSVAIALATFTAASAAFALGPGFTAGKASAGARLQYGIDMEDYEANPYGLGFGLRGGYTLDMNVYIGGNFEYFFGGSETVGGAEFSWNVWQLQVEGGYDLGFGPKFVVRPQLGLGLGAFTGEFCYEDSVGRACEDPSETDFSLTPGALALYDVGAVFLAGEVRFNAIMAEETATALFIGVGAGMTF